MKKYKVYYTLRVLSKNKKLIKNNELSRLIAMNTFTKDNNYDPDQSNNFRYNYINYIFIMIMKTENDNNYILYFNLENQKIELKNFINNYFENNYKNSILYMKSDHINYIFNCINNYILIEINRDYFHYKDMASYLYSLIYTNSTNSSENSDISSSEKKDEELNDLDIFEINEKYKHLWIQCENCYGSNYKKLFKFKMNICEHCGYHLKMDSSDRIELFLDSGTWTPMNDEIYSINPIEFNSEDESYLDRIYYYKEKTGLSEAIQTGIGKLNGITVAMGIMDFRFIGGSMGSVVGERITRLIEYATNQSLPIIIMCASGGARMQEGSLSLMQMAKISSALYDYQLNKKSLYISILTSPTTGGVTASFGMLGNIIIAEPNAYIAFAGKRVIEQTLNKTVPEGLQVTEFLFQKGLFDLIVPRNLLKGVLAELFELHGI
uniref:Acetyl-coenzyme A carboxylase carboxyl transferase subunit beta, chloroplastic n=1 Tax=Didymoplexis pallens TaxID=2848458 RepID=A0A976UFH2_9ASPA|nr:acetyl-CoA carboxylase carboxyltransferase beta subunit [Didymoplexis pallens]UVG41003.1 acetyl-CoA carboxylase carboxyltransferase beta subunit [Didymoplexis pallens]